MSSKLPAQVDGETTRRTVIVRLVVAGAAGALVAGAARRAAAASVKLPPGDADYQASPKGNAKCELCVNWQAPNTCKLVSGSISPTGWCSLFARKT